MKMPSSKKHRSKKRFNIRMIFSHVKFNVYPFDFVLQHLVSQSNNNDQFDLIFFSSVYNVPVLIESQTSKPATLHLSQVVNRVSRCHYVLRRYVREAEKYSSKPEEKPPSSYPSQESQKPSFRSISHGH